MHILESLSSLILLSCFVLVSNKHPQSYISTFRLQSLLIALAAFIEGTSNLANEGTFDVLIVAFLILVLKVVIIPRILKSTLARVRHSIEQDYILNIPMLVIMSAVIVVFTYFFFYDLFKGMAITDPLLIVNSISVVLIGMFFMISRKKVMGEIVGFLVIENGLFVTAMFSTHGMPLVVDLGIFIDLITAVLIMGLMVYRISDVFDSTDTNELKNLRG